MESSTSVMLLKNLCRRDDSDSFSEETLKKTEAYSAMKMLHRFLLYGRFDDFAVDIFGENVDASFSEETIWNLQLLINDINFGGLVPRFMETLIDIQMRMNFIMRWNDRVPLVLSQIAKIPEHRQLAMRTAITHLYNSTYFLLFIKFSMETQPVIVDDILKNAIKLWYSGGHPRWLAKEVTSSLGGLFGWSHEMVLDIGDLRNHENPSLATIYDYIVNVSNPDYTNDFSTIGTYLFDIEQLNLDPTANANVITTEKLVPAQIHPENLDEFGRLLWEKLVPNMEVKDLLYMIPEFHERGYFHNAINDSLFNTPFIQIVVDKLRESRYIHPSVFLLAVQTLITTSGSERSPGVRELCAEVNQELVDRMTHAFKTIGKTNLNISVIVNCNDFDDHRCGPYDGVDAKVAAAMVTYSLKRAASNSKICTFERGQPVNLEMDDFYDALDTISRQNSQKMSPEALKDFLVQNYEDDLYVIIGYQTDHTEYLDVLEYITEEYHLKSKFVFCNLGHIEDPSNDPNHFEKVENRRSNLLVTSEFNERTCDLILSFASIL